MLALKERLFDVEKVAPRISPADKLASSQREYERTGRQNVETEISRAAPYFVEKIGSVASETTLIISGLEIPVEDISSRLSS